MERREETSRDEDTEIRMRRNISPEPETYERTREPAAWEERRAIMERERVGARVETWRPPTAGILLLLAGAANLLAGTAAVAGGTLLSGILGDTAAAAFFGTVAGVGLGGLLIVLGIISIIGGAFALMRRRWGWSLAGSITALFPTPALILGMLSLIFVVLGRNEFNQK